jgi:tetratricopeptide (TPR) repeat protein
MLKNIWELFDRDRVKKKEPDKPILSSTLPPLAKEKVSNFSEQLQLVEDSTTVKTAEFQIWQGVKLEKQGKLEQAITCYIEAIKLCPKSIEAHQILAVALKKQGRLSEAAIHQRQAIELQKDRLVEGKAQSQLANELLIEGDRLISLVINKDASNVLQKSTNNGKQQIERSEISEPVVNNSSHLDLIIDVPSSEDRSSAAIVLPTLSSVSPGKYTDRNKLRVAQIHLEQALAYSEAGDWEKGVAACQESLKICPDLAEAYKVWGNILQRVGKTADAIGCYAKAISIEPDMAEVYANLGSLYAKKQKWNQALDYFQQAIAINPSNAGVYRSLARIWEELGEPDKALDYLFEALQLEPETLTPRKHFQLARELWAENKRQKAITCYRYAVQLDPNFKEAYLQLARALEQNGQWKEAGVYYQKLIELQDLGELEANRTLTSKRIRNLLAPTQKNAPPQPKERKPIQAAGEQKLLAPGSPKNQPLNNKLLAPKQPSSSLDREIASYLAKMRSQPQNLAVHINLGSLYAQKQDWQRAIACYQKAIKIDPNNGIIYRNLAKVYRKIGQKLKALEITYRGYSLAPATISGQEHLQLGNALLKEQQIQPALACYRRAIEAKPSAVEAYIRLGGVLESQNNRKGAIACYLQSIEHQPNNPQAYILLGQNFAQEKDWQQAVKFYRQAVALQPKNNKAHHDLGDALSKLERWQEAIEAYRQAIAIEPNFSWSHNNLGYALLKLHRWQESTQGFRGAIELNPQFPWSYYNLGEACLNLQDWQGAIDAYEQAAKLESRLPDIDNKLAMARLRIGRDEIERDSQTYSPSNFSLEEAIFTGDLAIKTNPKDELAYLQLGKVLRDNHCRQQAINCYRRAIKNQVRSEKIYLAWGEALSEIDRWDEASKIWQQAIEIAPESLAARQCLAKALSQQGEIERACLIYLELGETLAKQERLDEALAILQQSLAIDPNFSLTHNCLGNVYFWQGKSEAAIAAYQQAIQLDPNLAWAYKGLGDTFSRQGKVKEATDAYRQAIKLAPQIFDSSN